MMALNMNKSGCSAAIEKGKKENGAKRSKGPEDFQVCRFMLNFTHGGS